MEIRKLNDRQLNMAIDRKDYIKRANGYSEELINHIIKLYGLKSKCDEKGWLSTVSKGFKLLETKSRKGNFIKPKMEYLSDITTIDNNIDLNALDAQSDVVLNDPRYSKLLKNPNFDLEELANIILDLINQFDSKTTYTKDEVTKLIDDWWNTYKWY